MKIKEEMKMKSFPLVTNYNLSIEELVEKLREVGRHYKVDPNITSENFPRIKVGVNRSSIILVSFNYPQSPDEVSYKIRRGGYRFADLYEFLAFGIKYPDLQRRFEIATLGPDWLDANNELYFPSFHYDDDYCYYSLILSRFETYRKYKFFEEAWKFAVFCR